MIKPIRIYLSDKSVWHAEICRDGRLRYFSLRTKNEAEARCKWHRYMRDLEVEPQQRDIRN